MEPKEIFLELRTRRGFSQEQLAEKIHVTRQAVSRWETGETVPNTETLKLLSKLFDVSINTLLGSPRQLVCQCCGMPLEDANISREPDGTFNEAYCKWCYTDGKFVYTSLEELLDFLEGHLAPGAGQGLFCSPAAETESLEAEISKAPALGISEGGSLAFMRPGCLSARVWNFAQTCSIMTQASCFTHSGGDPI